MGKSIVDDRHHPVQRNVETRTRAPFVRSLYHHPFIERMMGVTGHADIVVPVEPETRCKHLRSIALAPIAKLLLISAEISIQDSCHALPPLRRDGSLLAVSIVVDIRFQSREELVEVGEAVAHHRPGSCHCLFRHDTEALDDTHHVVAGAALREPAAPMHADMVVGTVEIILIRHVHLGEVHRLAGLAQNLTLQETAGGIVPARPTSVLILHRRYRVGFDGCEYRCFVLGKARQCCRCKSD